MDLKGYFASLDEQSTRTIIKLTVVSLLVALGGVFWFFRGRSGEVVGFRLREADRARPKRSGRLPSLSTRPVGATLGKPQKPLLLNGIRIDGPAHEVLGLKSKQATKAEIQKAYRDLMKRYHPDLVGRPGSREWKDAQQIAEALNKAKDELLKHTA